MKSFLRAGLFLLLALGWVATAGATIRYVDTLPGDNHFNTINLAYTAALSGDTLLIRGTYTENLVIAKNVTILGAGIDGETNWYGYININTGATNVYIYGISLQRSGNAITINSNGSTVKIGRSAITATGGSCVVMNAAVVDLEIDSCIMTFSSSSCIVCKSGVSISNSIFQEIGGTPVVFSGSPDQFILKNSCVLEMDTVFGFTTSPVLYVVGTVFYGWDNSSASFGTLSPNSTLQFSASSIVTIPSDSGNNAFLTSNPFINYNSESNYFHGVNDLHLAAGANGDPCRDTGDPNLLDLDGTRSDMGIYGGPTPFIDSGAPSYPFVSNLTVPPSITAGQPLPVSSTGRIGREY